MRAKDAAGKSRRETGCAHGRRSGRAGVQTGSRRVHAKVPGVVLGNGDVSTARSWMARVPPTDGAGVVI